MTLDTIIVTTSSFHSQMKQDLINSNNLYVTRLFQHQMSEDKIFQDALLSYYLDFYESHITHGGFYKFIESYYPQDKVIYYINTALESIKNEAHLELFKEVFQDKLFENSEEVSEQLDAKFKMLQHKERLRDLNHDWLLHHPKLHIVPDNDFEKYLRIHLFQSQQEERHVTIIKELCRIINEDFIAITAGDRHNIYTQSWYFKTTKNYYYMIEKDHIVTLYNSFTKEVVTKGRLVANKTDTSIISNFISKILA